MTPSEAAQFQQLVVDVAILKAQVTMLLGINAVIGVAVIGQLAGFLFRRFDSEKPQSRLERP